VLHAKPGGRGRGQEGFLDAGVETGGGHAGGS
jgi:hypothetical protein